MAQLGRSEETGSSGMRTGRRRRCVSLRPPVFGSSVLARPGAAVKVAESYLLEISLLSE